MIRRFVFSLFAFAVLLAFADDPIYYGFYDPISGEGVGYAWVPSFSDVPNVLFPNVSFVPDDGSFGIPDALTDPNGDYLVYPISPSDYPYYLPDVQYKPFSSDPAYASPTPSDPPSGGGGGGGGSPSGADGEGGFDPAGSFGGLSSVLGAVALALGGLLTAAALVCLAFLYWRKTKTSFHICEDRYGRLSLSKTRW